MSGGVFINYRGADSPSYAALLYVELSRRFGTDLVFRDSESIPGGSDFVDRLLSRVRGCRVLLAVIGPRWLTAAGRDGRRIDDPQDWIRRELAEAFAAGATVVPVLTDGASMPVEAELPGDIAALGRCQYRRLRHRDVTADLERICADLAAADPGLAAAARRRSEVPRQLPADVSAFTGRAVELADLDRLLATTTELAGGTGDRSTAVVISAVSGTAGVGKTALAVRWAHRVRGTFPDGQLYVNLRGYDTNQAMSPAEALAGFLRALGVGGQDIPLQENERAAAYRTLLDGRRMLVVLDNAATAEQVRPLLPGSASCLVVVTSRDSLAGLVAVHGAHRLDLDLLPPADAVALLRTLVGERVAAEPEAAAALAAQCARLPLALRVAAELVADRPGTSLADLVDELSDFQQRLDLLDAGGDPRGAVRSVFSWSYQHLPADAGRTFRLLGLHPGPHLGPYAAAALADTSLAQAQRLLGQLARAHLIDPTRVGRYGMHDLLRAYATHLAHTEGSEEDRRAALTRLFDHYLATAATAMDTLHPAEQHRRPRIPTPATPAPPLGDSAAARAWLDAERATLVAVTAHTAAHGWPGHTTRLAATLFRADFPRTDYLSIHTHALHAARHTGDRAAEADALIRLGTCSGQSYEPAVDHLQQGLTVARQVGDRVVVARALLGLGYVYLVQGRHEQALDHLRQALTVARQTGERPSEAWVLTHLGLVYWRQSRYQQALGHHQQALTIARQIGNPYVEAYALDHLGLVYWRQGRYQQAIDHYQQSLTIFRDIGDRDCEAHVLADLGLVHCRQGHYQQALGYHQQALTISHDIGSWEGEFLALNGIGEVLHATGQPKQARIQHNAALVLAVKAGNRYEQARAHNGLAHAHHTTGDPDQARHHWQQALTLYTDLGVPDADDIRAHLATLDHQPPTTDKPTETPRSPTG